MVFRFHTRQLSQATRGLAATVFIVGMLLIGFAMLIFALPRLFGHLVAGMFCFIGLTVIVYSVRLFIAAWKMDRSFPPQPDQTDQSRSYRQHVDVKVQTLDDSQ